MGLFDGIIDLFNPGDFDVVEITKSPDSDEPIERPMGRGSVGYAEAQEWAKENNHLAQTSPCRQKYEGKSYAVRPSDRDRNRAPRSRAATSDRYR